jgi:hypothetical protein
MLWCVYRCRECQFEVLAVVLLRIQVLWDITLCHGTYSSKHFGKDTNPKHVLPCLLLTDLGAFCVLSCLGHFH